MHQDFHLHGHTTLDQAPADPSESQDQQLAAGEVKGQRLDADSSASAGGSRARAPELVSALRAARTHLVAGLAVW